MANWDQLEEIGTRPTGPSHRLRRAAAYSVLVAWAVILLAPLAWMLLCALTPDSLLRLSPPVLGWKHLTLENFTRMYERSDGLFLKWFWNTLYIALVATVGSTFLSAMAGYTFARLRFPGKTVLFWLFIATLMVPYEAIVLPLFIIVNNMLGLNNTHWAIILPQLSAPLGIFLCRQYMLTLPDDLENAARIEGSTEFGIFWRIALPMSKPVLAVLAIFTFMWNWSNFFWPLVILRSESKYVLEVGLSFLQDNSVLSSGLVMAGATAAIVPMIVFFLIFQRQLIHGLAVGVLRR